MSNRVRQVSFGVILADEHTASAAPLIYIDVTAICTGQPPISIES